MSVTFELERGQPRAERALPETSLREAIERLTRAPVEACGANADSVVAVDRNAMIAAVWRAFAEHRPLVLSPDAVWLCLAQGFAVHLGLHAERLRERFVRDAGRPTLTVWRDDFKKGAPDNRWPEVFSEFSRQIAGHVGRRRDLVVCDFSTTGPVERAASELVLMDAMKQYFEYELLTICGIPEITLTGTQADWIRLRDRARALAEFELEWWTEALVPVLDQFVAAQAGRPDVAFWERLYDHGEGCGGERFNGWISLLFPYLTTEDEPGYGRNPAVEADEREPVWTYPDSIPPGLGLAPLQWQHFDRRYAMELLGGFVGIAQDPATLAIGPAIGWAVREAAGDRVVQYKRRSSMAAEWDGPVAAMPTRNADGVHVVAADYVEFIGDPEEDTLWLAIEPVRCGSDGSVGRLILAGMGLFFIPDAGPRFAELRGRPPLEQLAGVSSALHVVRVHAMRAFEGERVSVRPAAGAAWLDFELPRVHERLDEAVGGWWNQMRSHQ